MTETQSGGDRMKILLAVCALISPFGAAFASSANTVAVLETRLHYMEQAIERNTQHREAFGHEA